MSKKNASAILSGLIFFSVLVLSITCENEKVNKIELNKDLMETVKPKNDEVLKVAIGAMLSPQRTFINYVQLLNYLSEKLSMPVMLIQRQTYLEINELLGKNEVDLGFICSGPYVSAHKTYGVEVLVIPIVNGKAYYRSYIIVAKESNIKNLDELKDKRFAFTDNYSLTGCLFPSFLIAQKGFTPEEYFSEIIFTHSHDNSIIAVNQRIVDGAAVDNLVYDYLSENESSMVDRTRIILISPPFGIPPVVVPKNLSLDLKQRLKDVFLNMDKDEAGKNILKKLNIDRFETGSDSLYESIMVIMDFIEHFH